MSPPVIGVSSRLRPTATSWGDQPTHTVTRFYTDAVAVAGGIPVLIPPLAPELVSIVLDRLDGVVLTGGGDLAAELHGRQHHDTMYDVDPERDAFELALVRRAAERRLPLLAICRGMQVVNVALGGDLILDIPTETDGGVRHYAGGAEVFEGHQTVRLDPDSRMARLLSVTELKVNSMHHQAVRRAGQGLRPVGWAEDGVIEALEPENGWPLWAVQWHPECLAPTDPLAGKLFRALVEAASV